MQGLRVHGSIFFLLKKFVVNNFRDQTWELLNERIGTQSQSFSLTENYPLETINLFVDNAAELTGRTRHDLMEAFGRYLVNDLFMLYKDYVRPEWRTFDIILHTESVMHGAVRRLNSTANPPILNVSEVNKQLLIIDYHSRRKMAALAMGIIRGIADYYDESDAIKVKSITDLDDERVQIRVDFTGKN